MLGLFLILVFTGLATIRASVASAQTPSPDNSSDIIIDAIPAFEGNFKYGEWLPVIVDLTNKGPDTQTEIRIPIQGSGGTIIYSLPVELAAGAHKQVSVYVLPNNFSRQLNVELYSDETLLETRRISIQPSPNVNYFVGIVAPQRNALSLISTVELPGIQRAKVLIDIPLNQLPENFEGLRSFDLLILNDTDTSTLTPKQIQALETWVRHKGRLIVGGGAGALLTASGIPNSLIPGQVVSTISVDQMPELEEYLGEEYPILLSGPFVAAQLAPKGGRSLAGTPQMPILHEWKLGNGHIDFIALDPAASPFDAWNGATSFWTKLISPDAEYPEYLPTDISARQQFASNMPYALSNLPMLDLPSTRGLAVMLALYIVLVGPLNYLVLQRMKRLHLAWITIPAITVIFSAASFGLGYLLHGTDVFINKIAVIQVGGDGSAHFDSFIGVFSPAQTAYQIEVEGGGLVSPLTPYYDPWNSFAQPEGTVGGRTMTLVQGNPAYVKGLSVDQWSMQSFVSEGSLENFGEINSNISLVDDGLVGTIRNDTSYAFEDAFVILGSKFTSLGMLAPGQETSIELSLNDLGGPNYGSPLSYGMFETTLNSTDSTTERRTAESRRTIVENLFERTPPYVSSKMPSGASRYSFQTPVFIGWIDQAPPEVRILGVEPGEQSSAAVVMPLSYSLPESGLISIPVGLIPGKLVSIPVEGGTCGMPGNAAVYMNRGEAVFEFQIAMDSLELQTENLKLGLWTDSGSLTVPEIELYSWESEDWAVLSGLNLGINLIPRGSEFVRSDGIVQVRMSSEGMLQSCFYTALGLEGRWH